MYVLHESNETNNVKRLWRVRSTDWKPSLIIQAHLGGRLKKIIKLKSAHNIMSQKYSLVPYKSTG